MRTNRIVAMGTELGSVTPVPAIITLDKETVSSRVTWGGDTAVGATILRAVHPIMTVAKTLKAVCVRGCRGQKKLFGSGKNTSGRGDDVSAIGEADGTC